jgi:hypothetical protein
MGVYWSSTVNLSGADKDYVYILFFDKTTLKFDLLGNKYFDMFSACALPVRCVKE